MRSKKSQKKRCLRAVKYHQNRKQRITTNRKIEKMSKQYAETIDISLIEPIVRCYLPKINKLAWDYMKFAESPAVYDDLLGAGALGVVNALKHFSAHTVPPLSTYTDKYIKIAIKKEVARFNLKKTTRNLSKLFRSIKPRQCKNCPRRCSF